MKGTLRARIDADAASSGEPAFAHPALFYRDETEYLAGTVPVIEAGLAAGEPVAVIVPDANLRLIRDALGSADSACEHIWWLDMTEAGRNPGRVIPGVLHAFADAHLDRPVRIIVEPIWAGRTDTEYPACVQHEALVNRAFEGRSATILCLYDAARLDPRTLADAEATHPVIGDGQGWRPSDRYAPDDMVAAYNLPFPEPAMDTPVDTRTVHADSLSSARRAARERARRHGLSIDQVVDVELAITELLSNSITHGGGSGVARIWSDGEDLVCEVRDAGHLADPLAGRLPAGPLQGSGRGLLLVNQIADLVRVHAGTHGTTIRTYFRRRPTTSAAASPTAGSRV